jgi:DNA-binding response OmpR family regulator
MPARILVLDDEPAIRALVARALAEEGHEVVTVADGLLGLSAAAAGDFDLVVTNNCMPRMSGAEVIERLHRVFPTLPVLHLDDLSHPSGDEFHDGVQTLYKPFSVSALQDAVRKLLMG